MGLPLNVLVDHRGARVEAHTWRLPTKPAGEGGIRCIREWGIILERYSKTEELTQLLSSLMLSVVCQWLFARSCESGDRRGLWAAGCCGTKERRGGRWGTVSG